MWSCTCAVTVRIAPCIGVVAREKRAQERSIALLHSSETDRQLEGTVAADELSHTAGRKGQAKQGGKKPVGRRPRRRRKKREPGRGHFDKDRPAIIAWVSRQGPVVIHAVKDFTVKTVQKGYVHEFVNQWLTHRLSVA